MTDQDRPPQAPAATSPAAGASRPLYLVACSAAKLAHRAPAADLYTSDLFAAARDYAEAHAQLHGSRWAVLSARHGLLDPAQRIDPYDLKLASLTPLSRSRWALLVVLKLEELEADRRPIVVLAGKDYADPLRYQRPGWAWEEPLRGWRIGERRRWLRANLPPGRLPLFDGISTR